LLVALKDRGGHDPVHPRRILTPGAGSAATGASVTRTRVLALILAASLAAGLLLTALDGKGFALAGFLGYAVLVAVSLIVIVWVHRPGVMVPRQWSWP
jgi:hypothetical protein